MLPESAGKKREGIRMIFQINRDLKISGRLCLEFDPEKIGCVTPQSVILGNWAKLRKRDIIFSVLIGMISWGNDVTLIKFRGMTALKKHRFVKHREKSCAPPVELFPKHLSIK